MNVNVYNSWNQCGNDIKPKLNQNYHMNVKPQKVRLVLAVMS